MRRLFQMSQGARALGCILLLCLACAREAGAIEEEGIDLHLAGDIKGFYFSIFPYESSFLPDEPFGQAVLDLRLKLDARYGSSVRVDLHHQLTTTTVSALGLGDGLMAPAQGERDLPQAVDLSWRATDDPSHTIEGRMDRLAVRLRFPTFHLVAGRQAVTFGRAYFFTPLDLVAPFSPLVVDREYKPGIDAVRADYFFGVGGQVTALAAYAGSWETDGLIFAGRAGMTLAGWDLALFSAAAHRDFVLGLESSGAAGPVSVRAEGTLTFPSGDEDDPFVRAVAGADHLLLAGKLQLTGEVYMQTIGVDDPADILELAMTERYLRNELWTMGRWYTAVSARYELSPLIHVSGFGVINLADPSALIGPGLSWSIADSAHLVAGAYLALGDRPEEEVPFMVEPKSELGLYPSTAYVAIQSYF